MKESPVIVWFRQDLRLNDNDAFLAAVETGEPIIPCYIWAPEEEGDWAPGAASRVWLRHSLAALRESLEKRGLKLIVRRGPTEVSLRQLIQRSGAGRMFWNRRFEPEVALRDARIEKDLRRDDIEARSWNASLLVEPESLLNLSGKPYQVFTPFWKACLKRGFEQPKPKRLPAGRLSAPEKWPASLELDELELLPRRDWHKGLAAYWTGGEEEARRVVKRFVVNKAAAYANERNTPSIAGTSSLSPHLHFGEIGPREVYSRLMSADSNSIGSKVFLSEIGWREFAHYLLFHFPETVHRPLKPDFERFPWEPNDEALRRWQKGETGYPIVDAGMRQLWQTGWMHNRVRMIVASFLVKHLLQPWQRGAEWFWDTLVDADLASNTMGWQWTAGCGADAAPFFRVFNPIAQGEKFDPDGAYVKKWLPELNGLPDQFVHQPWVAPADALEQAGVKIGSTYPAPIVDHKTARARALMAYERMKL
jgi:deoxyribodipyrimidine photo-lyase